MTRRQLLTTATIAPLMAPSWSADVVYVAEFSVSGQPLGRKTLGKIRRTDAEWRRLLSPLAFDVTRRAGTERAFTGPGWNNHADGLYRCICCATALFDSATKFDSGTGWPSFYQPIATENVRETRDASLGAVRTAVACALCDAHLGHVFGDGPRLTGLRYCMNATALRFFPRAGGKV